MKFAFQMDPIASFNFSTDSTWALMKEACLRGEAYYFLPQDLFWKNGELLCNAHKIQVAEDDSYKQEDAKLVSLNEMDVIFIRQDPPYDINYLTYTYLLERISHEVLILNDPKAIRNFPEKLSVLDYPDLIPPTLITSSLEEARAFAKDYERVAIKPLYSFGGDGVFCTHYKDMNLPSIVNCLLAEYKAPFIVQKYVSARKGGDKRIILVDGEMIDGYVRFPLDDDFRANLACGGVAKPSEMSNRDREICATIAPMLKQNNLFLCGIDIIGGHLMEINVTSPTGLVTIEKYSQVNVTKSIFDKIYNKIVTNSYN